MHREGTVISVHVGDHGAGPFQVRTTGQFVSGPEQVGTVSVPAQDWVDAARVATADDRSPVVHP